MGQCDSLYDSCDSCDSLTANHWFKCVVDGSVWHWAELLQQSVCQHLWQLNNNNHREDNIFWRDNIHHHLHYLHYHHHYNNYNNNNNRGLPVGGSGNLWRFYPPWNLCWGKDKFKIPQKDLNNDIFSNAARPPTPVSQWPAPPGRACVMVSTCQRALHAGRAVRWEL